MCDKYHYDQQQNAEKFFFDENSVYLFQTALNVLSCLSDPELNAPDDIKESAQKSYALREKIDVFCISNLKKFQQSEGYKSIPEKTIVVQKNENDFITVAEILEGIERIKDKEICSCVDFSYESGAYKDIVLKYIYYLAQDMPATYNFWVEDLKEKFPKRFQELGLSIAEIYDFKKGEKQR